MSILGLPINIDITIWRSQAHPLQYGSVLRLYMFKYLGHLGREKAWKDSKGGTYCVPTPCRLKGLVCPVEWVSGGGGGGAWVWVWGGGGRCGGGGCSNVYNVYLIV